jgi:citrate lyase subunit beta/citryl-CoA lyase/(S)-citramalyl-CoA lyase
MASTPVFRTFLFVPGNRPERFAKALGAGADIACVDLEDAVAPADKPTARGAAFDYLAEATAEARPLRAVRLNSLRTRVGLADLAALADRAPRHGIAVLPKVESQEEVRIADAILTEAGCPLPIIVLIETLRGIEAAMEIAAAPRMAALLFGGVDLAAELGVDVGSPEPLLHARMRLAHAAHAAGIEVLDAPCIDVRSVDAAVTEAEAARRLGFTGKAVLHPGQVAAVNAVFTPSAEEVEQARRVVEAFRDSPTGITTLDGKLVEKPVVRRMERVLARAKAAGI